MNKDEYSPTMIKFVNISFYLMNTEVKIYCFSIMLFYVFFYIIQAVSTGFLNRYRNAFDPNRSICIAYQSLVYFWCHNSEEYLN